MVVSMAATDWVRTIGGEIPNSLRICYPITAVAFAAIPDVMNTALHSNSRTPNSYGQ